MIAKYHDDKFTFIVATVIGSLAIALITLYLIYLCKEMQQSWLQ